MLGHLVLADDLAHPHADLVLAREPPFVALRGGDDAIEQASVACNRTSRLRARSAASSGLRHTIKRSPGIGIATQFDQVRLVEQGHLQRPRRHSWRMADERKALIQSRPAGSTSSRMRASVSMPRSPTSHHPFESEALAQLVDLRTHSHRISRVAVEHLDRHRDNLMVAQ